MNMFSLDRRRRRRRRDCAVHDYEELHRGSSGNSDADAVTNSTDTPPLAIVADDDDENQLSTSGRRRWSPVAALSAGVQVLLSLSTLSMIVVPPVSCKLFSTQMSPRVITTRFGRLRGMLITLPDPTLPSVDAYLGIEYASLFGSELRFTPPTTPSGPAWEGVRTALKFKPVCPQPVPDVDALMSAAASGDLPMDVAEHVRRLVPFIESQQEDCLYLNIYVPSAADRNISELLPVVLFVHGESYNIGTGNAYDGSVMAAFGRVVVVTFNYRLGILGFLTTSDGHAPGNYALLDQVAALHWIADNIEAFGGDPSSVTLLGDRVGGAMVGLLTLSPAARGRSLFQRAIVHSGSLLSPWAVADDANAYSQLVAERLNCTNVPPVVASSSSSRQRQNFAAVPSGAPDNAKMIQCLRRIAADRLANAEALLKISTGNDVHKPSTVAVPSYSATFGPTLTTAAVSGIVSATAGTAASLIDDVCASQPTKTSGDRSADRPAFADIPLLLGIDGNEGYAYISDHVDVDRSPPSSSSRSSSATGKATDSSSSSDVQEFRRWRKGLRAYVRTNYEYHQQKIHDVLAHNYNDWQNDYRPLAAQPISAHSTTSPFSNQKLAQHPQPTSFRNSSAESATSHRDGPVETGSDSAGRVPNAKQTPSRSPHTPLRHHRRIDDLAELIGDGQYGAPTVRLARLHSTCTGNRSSTAGSSRIKTVVTPDPGPATYLYAFDGTRPTADGDSKEDDAVGKSTVKARYKLDLAYVFGAPLADGIDPFDAGTGEAVYSMTDRAIARMVLTYWTNFIRTGNPNMPSRDRLSPPAVDWVQYEPEKQSYLSLGVPTVIRHHYKSHKMALWNDLLPRLHRPDDIDIQLHQLDPDADEDNSYATRFDSSFPLRTFRRPSTTRTTTASVARNVSITPFGIVHRRTTTAMTSSTVATAFIAASPTVVVPPRHRRTSSTSMPLISGSGFSHDFDDRSNPNWSDADVSPALDQAVMIKPSAKADTGSHLPLITTRSTLGLTLAVGCALLALNAVVFAATFCQWRKLVLRGRKSPNSIDESNQSLGDKVTIPTDAFGCHDYPVTGVSRPFTPDSIRISTNMQNQCGSALTSAESNPGVTSSSRSLLVGHMTGQRFGTAVAVADFYDDQRPGLQQFSTMPLSMSTPNRTAESSSSMTVDRKLDTYGSRTIESQMIADRMKFNNLTVSNHNDGAVVERNADVVQLVTMDSSCDVSDVYTSTGSDVIVQQHRRSSTVV